MRWLGWTLTAVSALVALAAAGVEAADGPSEPAPPAPALRVDGESVWSLRYALGDTRAIPTGGELFASGVPTFEQQLRLRIEGDVAQGVTVSADLDNVRSQNLQLLGVDLRWRQGVVHLGDLQLRSDSRYATSPAALIGARVDTHLGDFQLLGLVGRSRGIPATKTFVGQSSEETVELVRVAPGGGTPPYAPTRSDGMLVGDVRGAEGFRLARPFDPDFVKVWLIPAENRVDAECPVPAPGPERTLKELLDDYGLGFLYFEPGQPPGQTGVLKPLLSDNSLPPTGPPPTPEEAAKAYFALETGQFVGLASPDAPAPGYVLLRLESLDLLRAHVEALIRRYNQQNGLSGPEQKKYPFVRGSDLEREFLGLLRDYYLLWAGSGRYPRSADWTPASEAPLSLTGVGTCSAFREQLGIGSSNPEPGGTGGGGGDQDPASVFYLLGQQGLEASSVSVQLRRPEGRLEPAEDQGLRWRVFAEEGVLQVDFGGSLDELFGEEGQFAALRVRYRYTVAGGVYVLGTAVAVGSERVYLNGTLLRRNVDYTIDYELGVLVLLRDVGPSDRLTVNFEYFRGGLGASAEYNRNMFGLEGRWAPGGGQGPWRLSAGVFVEADEARPLVEPERARTMPNTHVVAALSGTYQPGGQEGSVAQGLWGRWDVAWSYDRFPIDDNLRDHQPNEVLALAGSREGQPGQVVTDPNATTSLVLVGHRAGFTVAWVGADGQPEPARWRRYDTAAGLSGLTVRAIAAAVPDAVSDGSWPGLSTAPQDSPLATTAPYAWLLATESGLTVVLNQPGTQDDTGSPFDVAANWDRRYTTHGLPSNDLRDVIYVGIPVTAPDGTEMSSSVWVATARGIAWADAGDIQPGSPPGEVLKNWDAWKTLPGSDEPLEVNDLAFAAVTDGETPSTPSRVMLAATSSGVLWIWLDSSLHGSSPAVQLLSVGGVLRVAGLVWRDAPDQPQRARLFLGTAQGLSYLDVEVSPEGDVQPSSGPFPVGNVAGSVHALQLKPEAASDPSWTVWAACDSGLYEVDPGRPASNDQDDQAPTATPVHVPPVGGGIGAFTALGLVPAVGTTGAAGTQVWTAANRTGEPPALFTVTSTSEVSVTEPDGEALPAQDPARFQDPSETRVRSGMAGQVALGYGWGSGGVELRYERIEPSFRAINDVRRQALDGWEVLLRQRLTPSLDVELSRSDRLTADPASGRAQRSLTDRGEARWELPLPAPARWASPPAIRASAELKRVDADALKDGFELTTLTRAVRVEERLWENRLTAALGYENVRHQETDRPGYVAHNLVADLSAALSPEMRLTVRFTYPLKITDAQGTSPPRVEGSQQLQLGATASRTFGAVKTSLTLSQQSGWRVTADGTSPDLLGRQATLSLSVPQLAAGGLRLQPAGRLSFTQTDSLRNSSTGLAVNGSLQASWAPGALEVTVSADRQYQWARLPSAKDTVQDRAEVTARSRVLPWLDPSLSLQVENRRATSLPDGRSTATLRRTASLRLGWAQQSRWPQEVRLSASLASATDPPADSRSVGVNYSVGLRAEGPWELSASLEASGGDAAQAGGQRRPHWRLSAQGRLSYRLSAQWSAGLSLGYSRGVKDPLAGVTSGALPGGPQPFAVGWAQAFVRAEF